MPSTETIEARHPDPGKRPTRVGRAKYEAYRRALLRVIPRSDQGVRLADLPDLMVETLDEPFRSEGKFAWWVTTVKLDLEARGLIERVPGRGPQRLRRPA